MKPTDAELEILHVLWQHGPSTVRFVHESLHTHKDVGYTTTLKLMQIMADKGLVRRNVESRTHVYEAAISEAEAQKELLHGFLHTAFRGSAMKLVMQALGSHQASREELDEIRKFIETMEGNDNDTV